MQPRNGFLVWLGGLSVLGFLATDMYLPAFAAMQQDLNTSAASISASLSLFLAGFALGETIAWLTTRLVPATRIDPIQDDLTVRAPPLQLGVERCHELAHFRFNLRRRRCRSRRPARGPCWSSGRTAAGTAGR